MNNQTINKSTFSHLQGEKMELNPLKYMYLYRKIAERA